jgi:RNA polymerase sigma-70 factor (ECF subfamily)
MFSKAVSYDLLRDIADCKVVDDRQQWVLTAMRKCGPELVTMLWRILGNEQDVCDAYQTTFLHLAHREGGEKPRHMKAYLFRTASNVAITMLRQHVIEDRKLGDMERSAYGAEAVQGDLDSRHLAETLRRCVARLPEHLRTVVTLRDLAELSYAEVARIMGISAGTARVYRCKAIQLLAMWMGSEDER